MLPLFDPVGGSTETTGNLFPFPSFVSPIQDQASALPLRAPKPSPTALTSTHAGRAIEETTMGTGFLRLRGFLISRPLSSGPNRHLPRGALPHWNVSCSGAWRIGGIRESLVASFVLTDVWFLSSVRSQVWLLFESRVGLCATFKLEDDR